ncbi:pantetheine-phosphate adenylyltransferase [Alkalibacterium kapii]|uniref:Phosphopantetheine adenylyltransferase n=1 Tax=Alkalibacterium kapii TaxID=426704 RepID=A0A511AW04_9LACT|nr:pantetheine-phosphate adenylyltransferase [Alkalibacterium kapii]GEK91513.1 phosphopantetheine adenylyltransferase [Alkalibacterium kapii]
MRKALYAGSFDPLTYGHLDVIKRAARLVDELIIVVSASTAKKYLFSAQERREMVKESLNVNNVMNCRVIVYDGLTVEVAEENDADILIRAIRSVKDFEYERDIANLNKTQNKNIETLCLFSDPKYQHISSTMVKEIAFYKGDLKSLVPQNVAAEIKRIMKLGEHKSE